MFPFSRTVHKKKLLCSGCKHPLTLGYSKNLADCCGVVYAEREVLHCTNLECCNPSSVIGETEVREVSLFARIKEVFA